MRSRASREGPVARGGATADPHHAETSLDDILALVVTAKAPGAKNVGVMPPASTPRRARHVIDRVRHPSRRSARASRRTRRAPPARLAPSAASSDAGRGDEEAVRYGLLGGSVAYYPRGGDATTSSNATLPRADTEPTTRYEDGPLDRAAIALFNAKLRTAVEDDSDGHGTPVPPASPSPASLASSRSPTSSPPAVALPPPSARWFSSPSSASSPPRSAACSRSSSSPRTGSIA